MGALAQARRLARRKGPRDDRGGTVSRGCPRAREQVLAVHVIASLALDTRVPLPGARVHWDDSLLVSSSGSLSVIADRSDVPLPAGVRFDATIALMLLCVALAGPLPALGVYLAPVVVNALTGHERMLRAGNLANLASGGWQAVAAALLLAGRRLRRRRGARGRRPGRRRRRDPLRPRLGASARPSTARSGSASRCREMAEALRDMAPAATVMVLLGAVTVVAYTAVGVVALALFAIVAVLPQSALTYAARTRPVAALDPLTAARRYARAMAMHLRPRPRRSARSSTPSCGSPTPRRRRRPGQAPEPHRRGLERGLLRRRPRDRVVERRGRPGRRARHDHPPVGAHRRRRADLGGADRRGQPAASGTTRRSRTSRPRPACGWTRAIVLAARTVVAQERRSEAVPAPEPRMHHLRVPEPLRRVMASRGLRPVEEVGTIGGDRR